MNKENMKKNIQKLIEFHLQYALSSYKLASRAVALGWDGFHRWFQIESSDANVHTRRMLNFLAGFNISYDIPSVNNTNDYNNLDAIGMTKAIKQIKEDGLNLCNEIYNDSLQNNDLVTARFTDWYVHDFFAEIDFANRIINKLKNGSDTYDLNAELLTKEEPDNVSVVQPFSRWGE